MKFTFVFLAVLYASFVAAAPGATSPNHRVLHLSRDVKVESFHPQSNYKSFGAGIDLPTSFASSNIADKATSFMLSQLNISPSNLAYRSGYENEVGQFAYARQMHNGIPILNSVSNVAFKGNKVVAFGESFVDTSKAADSKPTVDVNTVIPQVENLLQAKRNEVKPSVAYLARSDGTVALVHTFVVRNDTSGTWVEAHVDAHSGEFVSMTNYVADISYTVSPIWKQNIDQGIETLSNVPENTDASPMGWHGPELEPETSGNNVIAFLNADQSKTGTNFSAVYDPNMQPTVAGNQDASLTNAFYVANSYHDTLYRYGFTEAAFNFQNDNFDKGGVGNDRVTVSVQDPNGNNNADFATPPDGQSGRARMFIFNVTPTPRDSSMENDILIHEFTHGLSNRLTGGGSGQCLRTLESAGLGEGWSDAVASWFAKSNASNTDDFVIVTWVTGNPRGIRSFPYSTNANTNPQRYSDLQRLGEVHAIGEVWANMLHNVYANLLNGFSFSATARTDATGTEGNVVFLHLLVDALAHQPCNPTFVQARDAWIQADQTRYQGTHTCQLWQAFASRGLGVNAANFIDNGDVPAGC